MRLADRRAAAVVSRWNVYTDWYDGDALLGAAVLVVCEPATCVLHLQCESVW